jgi:hypothetical protein
MSAVLSALQVVALAAILLGLALALPLWGALCADGALVLVAATVAEALVSRPRGAPSDRRRGPNVTGAV